MKPFRGASACCLGLVLIARSAAYAGATNSLPSAVTNGVAVVPTAETTITNLPFNVGEELSYRVYWGFIPVGKTRVTTQWINEDGRRLILIRFRTRSNKVLSKLYPVDDLIESAIDPTTFRPVRFIKKLNEGRRHQDEITRFDFDALTAHWESKTKGKTKEYAIGPETRDLVSFMYHMRRREFVVGQQQRFQVMADEKLYDLYVDVREYERVKLPNFGKVPSTRVEPTAQFEGLFVRKGRMTVWVSRDARRVCTRIEAEIPLANVKALLWEVRGPGDDFWSRKMREVDPDAFREDDPDVERALRELDK